MSFIKNFIKKNLKFSFYLKEHVLKKHPTFEGVFYIKRRKGKKRLNLKTLRSYRENLFNWNFWNKLINGNAENYYTKERERIIAKEKYFQYEAGKKINLKPRQRYAVDKADGFILDVGCYDGKILSYLKRNRYECRGLDFSDYCLAISRENFEKAGGNPDNIVKGLFQKLPFEDKTFDTVISQETLEHFYFPAVMVSEIKRVLTLGGKFIGSVPLQNKIDSETHILYYEFAGVQHLLNQYFSEVEITAIKNQTSSQEKNLLVWQAVRS